MEKNYIAQAEKYYTLLGQKKVEELKQFLHPDVEFHGPMASLKGQEAVIQATRHFADAIGSLTILAKFGSGDETALIYHVDMTGISKEFPGVSWMRFKDGLIVRIQLFYDASRILAKKDEIFSK